MDFDLVTAPVARDIIDEARPRIVDIVRATYLAHHRGETVNPRSHFLRFPDKPEARIIALPAFLGGGRPLAGIKWISSFPRNIDANVARASSVLVLNDYDTGYAFACLESAQISAARTAASAVLAAEEILGGRTCEHTLIIGAGVLGRTVADFLHAQGWSVGQFSVFDQEPRYAERLAAHIAARGDLASVAQEVHPAIDRADLVVLVTTAARPWLTDPGRLRPGQCVLNVSLRDLSAQVVLAAHNVVDDVEHCLTADTSPHLAEQAIGHRDFIDGTLAQLLLGEVKLAPDKPTVFSPFGLGVLDLAVGAHVHREAARRGLTVAVPDFFGDTQRWSAS